MHKTITLHFSEIIHPSVHRIFPCQQTSILNIPPEVLSIIIVNMGLYTTDNIRALSVSQEYRNHVLSAIPYVDKLVTGFRTSMLDLFTGIKHLEVEDVRNVKINLHMFSKNIFRNLVFLSIPSRNISQLDFQPSTEITCYPKCTEITCYPKCTESDTYPNFTMPNLRCLEITSGCECSFECRMSEINAEYFPSLKIVRMSGHWLSNINKIQTLESVSISNAEIDLDVLNNLNISELSLTNCDFSENIPPNTRLLNIPSLRKLEIDDEYFMLGMLNNLNISELIIERLQDGYMSLDIPSVENLTILYSSQINIDKLHKLKVLTLDIPTLYARYYESRHLTTLNLVEHPVYTGSYPINLESIKSDYPSIRCLNIHQSSSYIVGHIPDKLSVNYI